MFWSAHKEWYDHGTIEAVDPASICSRAQHAEEAVCCEMYVQHPGTVIGKSWGNMKAYDKDAWARHNCDNHKAQLKHYRDLHNNLAPTSAEESCCAMYLSHPSTELHESWGDLDKVSQAKWKDLNCNKYAANLDGARKQQKREVEESKQLCAVSSAAYARRAGGRVNRLKYCCPIYMLHPLMAIGASWGDTSKWDRHQWWEFSCNHLQPELEKLRHTIAAYKQRSWLTWDVHDAGAVAQPYEKSCPWEMHRLCGHATNMKSCHHCAAINAHTHTDNHVKHQLSPQYCDFNIVCRLIVDSNTPEQFESEKFIAHNLVPKQLAENEGFLLSTAGAGTCILGEAEHLIDLWRAVGECKMFFPFQGTMCYTRDGDDFVGHIKKCCAARGGTNSATCEGLISPIVSLSRRFLKPRFDACVKSSGGECKSMKKLYMLCKGGNAKACHDGMAGQLQGGIPILTIFKRITSVARQLLGNKIDHLSPKAQSMASVCQDDNGDEDGKLKCGQAIHTIISTPPSKTRLEDFTKMD
eukprot:g5307.t1